MPKLDIYNISKLGVNVDKAQPFLEDGELTKAQNAIRDGIGEDGGLRKRPGLVEYNSVAAAGSILGGVGVPLGPGPSSSTAYYLATNNSPFWFTSTDRFNTAATTTLLSAMGTNAVKASAMLGGRMYYIAKTVADNQSIRVFDGVQDSLFTSLPSGYTFVQLATFKGNLYAAVAQSTTAAYVYRIDYAGRLKQIGAALPTAIVLFGELGFHNNDLYVSGQQSGGAVAGKIYRIREATATTATVWSLDYTHPEATGTVRSLCSFAGLMYAGRQGVAATQGAVLQRSMAGVYSVVDNLLSTFAIPQSMFVYNGALYVWATRYSAGNDQVRKSSDGTTWSTVLTSATADLVMQFYSSGDTMFAISKSTGAQDSYYTSTGSSWTLFNYAFTKHGFGFFRQ